jgi:hypothetical protein
MYSPKRRFRLFRDPTFASGGSIWFTNTDASGSSLSYVNSGYFDVSTSLPFTIEWYQYELSSSGTPRPFSFGAYNTADFAMSLEGSDSSRSVYMWKPTSTPIVSIPGSNILNKWYHFAVVGDGTNLSVYTNGTKRAAGGFANFGSTKPLTIANEQAPSQAGAFNGYITNFRWVTGTAVYSNTFTPPTEPLTAIPGTKLLLLANSSNAVLADSSPNAKTATTLGTVRWLPNSPFV